MYWHHLLFLHSYCALPSLVSRIISAVVRGRSTFPPLAAVCIFCLDSTWAQRSQLITDNDRMGSDTDEYTAELIAHCSPCLGPMFKAAANAENATPQMLLVGAQIALFAHAVRCCCIIPRSMSINLAFCSSVLPLACRLAEQH